MEPISGSMHVPIEGRVAIGGKCNQNHVENAARVHLERIRNTMQKPIEGGHVLAAGSTKTMVAICSINKGAIVNTSS